jgi:hypothetical protein
MYANVAIYAFYKVIIAQNMPNKLYFYALNVSFPAPHHTKADIDHIQFVVQ